MSDDQLNLKWRSFESNLSSSLKELRDSNDFFNVTLACETGQIQCHKLVISASSPLFLHLLRHNPHPHPLLYLKGVKFKLLLSVLDFMYDGQVNVAQEDLFSFMAIAEELKVKGLTQPFSDNDFYDSQEGSSPILVKRQNKEKETPQFLSQSNSPSNLDQEYTFSPVKTSTVIKSPPSTQSSSVSEIPIISNPHTHLLPSSGLLLPRNPFSVPNLENILSMVKHPFSNHHNFSPSFSYLLADKENNLAEINAEGVDPLESIETIKLQFREKCKSMIQKKKDGLYHCLMCDYNSVRKSGVRRHVERHVPSMRHFCNLCNRSFKNRNSLSSHRSIAHRVPKGLKEGGKGKKVEDTQFDTSHKLEGEDIEADGVEITKDDTRSNVTLEVTSAGNELQSGADELSFPLERGDTELKIVGISEDEGKDLGSNLSECMELVKTEVID